MKIANFNGVGGGTVLYTAHFPRMHPSDFRVRSLDGVADDWPIDYWTLEPFFAENDRMMGVPASPGDPGVPPRDPPMPPVPLGKTGTALRPGDEQARLALVAVRHRRRHDRVRRPRAVHQSRPLHARLRAGRQGQHRHHLLAARPARGRGAAHALPRARNHHQRAWHGVGRDLLRRRRGGAIPAGRGGHPRLQRHRHAAPAAQLGVVALPQWPGEFQRPGRQEPDAASVAAGRSAMSRTRWTASAAR